MNFDNNLHDDIPLTKEMSHTKWKAKILNMANKNKWKVLEIGSRAYKSKEGMKDLFSDAEYIGFDYYQGTSVDIVGDAHKLSSYFEPCSFDLVFSSSVFEHLAMPWLVSEEISKILKIDGYVFIETHYCFNSHSRPWHFFQFSEKALQMLFCKELGFTCIEAGVSTPIISRFSEQNSPHLQNVPIGGMYCHSEIFAKKTQNPKNFSWKNVNFLEVINNINYPENEMFSGNY